MNRLAVNVHSLTACGMAILYLSTLASCSGQGPVSRTSDPMWVRSAAQKRKPVQYRDKVYRALRGRDGDADLALRILREDPTLASERDPDGRTPLHVAARVGSLGVVEWLVSNGAETNPVSANNSTPLHLTTSQEIARVLVRGGADPRARNGWGFTAMQKAAQERHPEVVRVFVELGYELDLKSALFLEERESAKTILREHPEQATKPGEASNLWGDVTPLGIAAANGDLELVRLLLEAGAPVNGRTVLPNCHFRCATALTNAVWGKHIDIVKLLCQNGADCGAAGGKFYATILDYAREHSSTEMLAVLENHCPERVEPINSVVRDLFRRKDSKLERTTLNLFHLRRTEL